MNKLLNYISSRYLSTIYSVDFVPQRHSSSWHPLYIPINFLSVFPSDICLSLCHLSLSLVLPGPPVPSPFLYFFSCSLICMSFFSCFYSPSCQPSLSSLVLPCPGLAFPFIRVASNHMKCDSWHGWAGYKQVTVRVAVVGFSPRQNLWLYWGHWPQTCFQLFAPIMLNSQSLLSP